MENPAKPRPRPVDALFGDAPAPTYVVEAPQAVTTVSPPPPDKIASASPAATIAAPRVTAPPESFFTPIPLARGAHLPLTPDEEKFFAALPETIRALYDEIEARLADSPSVAMACIKLLRHAREAYQAGNLADAEFFVENVHARINTSAHSSSAARRPIVWFLWLWLLGTLGFGIYSVAITYVVNLTLFGILINPTFSIPLRAIGWGCLGGVIGAMWSLLCNVQRREYDPAFNMNYFARPVLGALLGAMLYLLSQAGILAGGGAATEIKSEEIPLGPVLLYLFAALAGFKQEYVFEFFDNLVRGIFRIQRPATQSRESAEE
ncbi:MAG: hypothetical protein HY070_12740 [Chloroflexi bacterium]|nr:hypothetical protein [Chloroflexota bacterium]